MVRFAVAETSVLSLAIQGVADGKVHLSASGMNGSSYVLQSSHDLVGWMPLWTIANLDQDDAIVDTVPAIANRRFYRLGKLRSVESPYWAKAQEAKGFMRSNYLTEFGSYRVNLGSLSNSSWEWYSISQIYADAALILYGDSESSPVMDAAYAWMNNFWNIQSEIGGYFAAVGIDGSGGGGPQYVDDNSLSGNVYLDCYAVSAEPQKTAYLNSAMAIANWLMFSGVWDQEFGGGFWWNTEKTIKPTQSNGLALQLFARLYAITGQTYYRDWALSIKDWLESQMYDPEKGLYFWYVDGDGATAPYFTYDNSIMIEANLILREVMDDPAYLTQSQLLAENMNRWLWNDTQGAYYFNSGDGRVNPCWSGWASQSLIKLYEADPQSKWLDYAQRNIDFMNTYLRDSESGGYFHFCNMDGTNPEFDRFEAVDQAWMQRVQALISNYR